MIWNRCPSSLTDAIEYKSEILRARSGEQRIRLRDEPRRVLNMTHPLTAIDYEKVRAETRANLPGPWYVPDWLIYESGVTAGQSVFFSDFPEAYDDAVLLFGGDSPEVLVIDEIDTDGNIITATPALADHLYYSPALLGYSIDGFSATLIGGPNATGSITFQVYESAAPEDYALDYYEGDPIMLDCPKLKSIEERVEREVVTVDNETSSPFIDDVYSQPRQYLTAAWMPSFGLECYRLRSFFQSIRGKQKRFWVPVWNRGITVTANISGASMTVNNFGYTTNYGTGHIFIKMKDGSYHAREVTGSVDNGATETLTLSSSVTANKSEIDLVALLMPVRLDADRIEFSSIAGYGANVIVPLVEVPDSV